LEHSLAVLHGIASREPSQYGEGGPSCLNGMVQKGRLVLDQGF
jgi:hypothetical protein